MAITPSTARYPKVIIQYCAKCKWQNRAIWYLQELLQTFPDDIADISIQPILDFPGIFQIIVVKSAQEERIVYKRRFKLDKYAAENEGDYVFDGFPDSKLVKNLMKAELGLEVGKHIERNAADYLLNTGEECKDCKVEGS
ncbi:hypothetical protein Cantr_05940 [Candida viswanathii]|uniref:Uncharacterized protein n=1 Tax=Candida viswanathii TaxID=5486 RepID=A0A367XRS4_9ASCO|nr:hypothetical protein Cantr_05940 [Candida viswanathii]